MIDKIIETSMNNKGMVILLVLLLAGAGAWALVHSPLDALPDLSDPQVIIFTEWEGRSPDIVEDQITFPVTSTLLAAPNIRFVRGQSMFGASFVYAIFEEGTDMYWARSRVLEYLNQIQDDLPEGVTPTLGPDATGVGWVFQYALVDTSGQNNLADLRSFNDWSLRYWLESLPGVAEVASFGGFVKQYQVTVDPVKLLAYDIPLMKIADAIRENNRDAGGRTIEMGGTEVMVRGRGYIQSAEDLENIVVEEREGRPVFVRDLGTVEIGGDQRRGLGEWNGKGETVGGIVVMRYGENAMNVINRVKERITEIEASLPPGVTLEVTYDRSELISEAISTLTGTLIQVMIIVLLVVGLFLLHIRSALVIIITLPVAVLISSVLIYLVGITVNVMSIAGIVISIGVMVDAAVVLVENVHKRLDHWEKGGRKEDRTQIIIEATKQVGRPIFFALLIITISFLPVFGLEAQEGRLFRPLAFTKTFAMLVAALLSISFSAALIALLVKGKIRSEENHPVSRFLHKMYQPVARFLLDHRWIVAAIAVIGILSAVPIYNQLGSEFMPPLEEGAILYMPTSPPGMSVAEAQYMLNITGQILKSFPEVVSVQGKAGRAQTATDPAPLNMFETTVILKDPSEWRNVEKQRWYSGWMPDWMKPPFRWVWPEERSITWDELVTEMDEQLQIPGFPNIWWMPVQTRLEMLATGVRAPVALNVLGPDLETIEGVAVEIEELLRQIPGTRSAVAQRPTGGYFLDIKPNRDDAARYGLSTNDVNAMIEMAVGGMNITETVEGRERYPVSVRYGRELRQDLDELRRVFIPASGGAQIPLGMLAEIEYTTGPPMIDTDMGQLRNLINVNVAPDRDLSGYVEEAWEIISREIELPAGVALQWVGQYQFMQRMQQRLLILIPVTILIIFFLLYLNFKSIPRCLIVLGTLPFATIGAFLLLWILDYNISVAVWVGMIALAGLSAELGVILLVYLDDAVDQRIEEGRMTGLPDLKEAVIEGSVQRLRPVLMTVTTDAFALIPVMFIMGVGATAMKSIAAPLIGGLATALMLAMLIIPSIYLIYRTHELKKEPYWKD
ncbi:MAG: efflux RND transporter permease subunit [Balneolaceae bacterium]